jgi:hypothetical protein
MTLKKNLNIFTSKIASELDILKEKKKTETLKPKHQKLK